LPGAGDEATVRPEADRPMVRLTRAANIHLQGAAIRSSALFFGHRLDFQVVW
jgi:hypothetical protein